MKKKELSPLRSRRKKYDKENYQITTKLISQMKRTETN